MNEKNTQGYAPGPVMASGIGIGGIGTIAPICATEDDAHGMLLRRAYELEQEAAGLRIIASLVPKRGVLGYEASENLLAAAKAIAGKGK